MSDVLAYLDCGCAIMKDGRRSWCPTCAGGGPRGNAETPQAAQQSAASVTVADHCFATEADVEWLTTLAGELLARIWAFNPDLASGAFGKYVVGETADGELAVWEGEPADATPALETFGGYDEGCGHAIAWMCAHREPVTAVGMCAPAKGGDE